MFVIQTFKTVRNPKTTLLCHSWIFIMELIHVLIVLASSTVILAGGEDATAVRVQVPEAATVGSKIKLMCLFPSINNEDFDVVWYRNNVEFYKYEVNLAAPYSRKEVLDSGEIDIKHSTSKKVVMNGVKKHNQGWYRCEVNSSRQGYSQGPASYMHVVEPLTSDPTIHLEQLTYAEGDTLRGDCIPPVSEVTPNITWLITGYKVQTDEPRESYDPEQNRTMLASHVSWVVEPTEGGDLRVECVADLFNISSRRSSVTVHVTKPIGVDTTTPPTTP